ncbi:MAG: hypothetical protein AAF392_02305 [Bacteroidota bacterium]
MTDGEWKRIRHHFEYSMAKENLEALMGAVKGGKRHKLVDTQGHVHQVLVHGANVQTCKEELC